MIRDLLHQWGFHQWRAVSVRKGKAIGHWRACELCGKLQKDTGWGDTEWATQAPIPDVEEVPA